jgi:hypothetical protein
MSPRDFQKQLRRHFDVVIGLLLASTPSSVEIALDRLEATGEQSWTDSQRATRRTQLINSRFLQLRRLAAYRDRGQFPLNEGHSTQPVPIFVDAHGTACAVGQLMRWSRREEDVATIHRVSNLVYVSDLSDGPINAWVAKSGLTIEEAALIQPTYGSIYVRPSIPDDAEKPLSPNWTAVIDDVRFSNFKLFNSTVDAVLPTVNADVSHELCRWLSCLLQPPEGYDRVLIQFDVETTSPQLYFVKPPVASTLWVPIREGIPYTHNAASLFLSEDLSELFFHHQNPNATEFSPVPHGGNLFEIFDPAVVKLPDSYFIPTTKMTVVTEMFVGYGRPAEAQLLQFAVAEIPEPCSWLLVCSCIAICAGHRLPRASSRTFS